MSGEVVVCTACGERYRSDLVVQGEPCPKVNCMGVLEAEDDE